ncbi:hypothetical protein COU37_03655 [Candidatus Micrarchaeota archaeon CG10_big_fil_rev_8_21_14_0_10_45_29]|nr:MAG: hypothetical protein COU37_03655 [Candidatus Micrarchaeota archaeon CG10_big_fil_rev_8_21_14_0_10_45_29]
MDNNSTPRNGSKLIKDNVFTPPSKMKKGAWLWWFWIFFMHDENTKISGKCRQIMILWSVKNDKCIKVNEKQICVDKQIVPLRDCWKLNGAAAAWYFDGEKMHENFILEESSMSLDPNARRLDAPGKTPSAFFEAGESRWITNINAGDNSFELVAEQIDSNVAIGPVHNITKMLGGAIEIEGTRIERMRLTGTHSFKGEAKKIFGTAYFQKIYLAAPPPQWYWGLYHFEGGSMATYMKTYVDSAMLKSNGIEPKLSKGLIPLTSDILIYHAPSGEAFGGHELHVVPKKEEGELYSHSLEGGGERFKFHATARAYSHACWSFEKKIGFLPINSTFKYNEYPAVMESLEITPLDGREKIVLKNGWGNMENSWGFII